MQTVFEFTEPVFTLKSEASDGAKLYDIKAISVTITGNRREYTKKELELGGRSLSFRPLNINHDHSRFLPYPESQTLVMDFDTTKMAVNGQMIIRDEWVNEQIRLGKIKKLSIEQIPTRGETCNLQKCTQHGIVFTAMALLTEDKVAGDMTTEIKPNTEAKTLKCDECDKSFDSQKDLDDHYEDEHETNDESISQIIDEVIKKRLIELEFRILEKYQLLKNLLIQVNATDASAQELIKQVQNELQWLVQDYVSSKKLAQDVTQNESVEKIIVEFSSSKSSVNAETTTHNQTMSANETDKTKTETSKETTVETTKTESQTQIISMSKEQFEMLMKGQAEQTKALTEALNILVKQKEDPTKKEASSEVDTQLAQKNNYESTVVTPAKFFESVKLGTEGNTDHVTWNLNKEEILAKNGSLFKTKTINYSTQGSNPKSEAITISAGDMPQVFSKQVILLKGGRMSIPLRQFCDIQEITNADRVNWYTITGFDVDDTTAEGTEPTNESQTVSKIQAVPALKRAVQTVNYSDIENAPFDLVEAVNQASVLGSIGVENTDIINTVPDAVTPDNADLTKMAWIRADTGADISADDIAVATATPSFLTRALEVLENRGHDTSAGNVVAVLHPQTIRELLDAINDKYYAQDGQISMRSLGVLERRYGIEIVASNKVKAIDRTTNDVYRGYVFIKGAVGLGVAKNLQLEAQKKVELSAIKVSARFRMKSAIIDASQMVRVSCKNSSGVL